MAKGKRLIFAAIIALIFSATRDGFHAEAEDFELLKYGDFDQWVTRKFNESRIIGGREKLLYEVGPTQTIEGAVPYNNKGGSPWATSNILARVAGVTKGSNAVFPDAHGMGKCVKLTTIMEQCKALGVVNVDVLVAGSIFLGRFFEPVKSTSDPYSKMEMGVPFTRRPKALEFDYKVETPKHNDRVYSSGFGKKKTIAGHDEAEVYIILQRRWEDENGNLYAKRVGTGRERYDKTTGGWVCHHKIPVEYGDITSMADYASWKGLIPESHCYYARNSKGKMVPVHEVGWDDPNAIPTHLMIMASSGSGTAYIGTVGLTLWIDNMGLVY